MKSMRTRSIVRVINTACGKTVSYLETDGQPNKMHSTEGPAIIYRADENKAPEYYLYGIKYSKAEWKDRVTFRKTPTPTETLPDSLL